MTFSPSLALAIAILAPADGPVIDRADHARHALATGGDPAKGRAVFADAKAGCVACHRVRGEGGAIGPDLSDVGGKFGREHLIESVLEPSRQIVEGYRPTTLATGDGRVLTGLVRSESADRLTVVDAQGREHVVAKEEIEARSVSSASIMPEGLAVRLSRDEFADLIAYLQSLRSSPEASLTLPPGFIADRVASGLSAATAMAVAPDGRVFLCEQTGALRVVKDGRLLDEPFASLRVDTQWERGLIGVAIDPDFRGNGRLYLNTVASEPYPHHRIVRLTAGGDVAAPGSEVVLLEGDDQRTLGGNVPAGHQGGAVHFGRDGKLYVAIGDQTAGEPATRLDTFQGKLLRINPDGSIPDDNPFSRVARGKYRAIWARGLRNPFSFAVQMETGRIFLNDVGQDLWEEVDEGIAGSNYGWPSTEGMTKAPGIRGPIHAYPAASIAGGAFCPRGPTTGFPDAYRGRYFFMDFVKGWIRTLDPDHPSEPSPFASGLNRPVDLAFAPDGSLYVLVRDAWVIDDKFRPGTGSLLKVRYSP